MRHQDRQGRICQDVPGGSAENQLQRRCVRHAIRIFSPMRYGGDGGAIKTGRPDSNKPASIVVMLGLDRLLALRRIRAIVQGI
jgi:hypothetical protein